MDLYINNKMRHLKTGRNTNTVFAECRATSLFITDAVLMVRINDINLIYKLKLAQSFNNLDVEETN